ncbi:hypothetical protein PSAB6_60048 [Paraburkholderia sabiae]|nr:hypothetical protein PSAB6_60048 [Paraburkholderia sabiae]
MTPPLANRKSGAYARISDDASNTPCLQLWKRSNLNRKSSRIAAGWRSPSCTGGVAVECVVTSAALEAYFWLEPRASDARMLKTFCDGYRRLRAIAERGCAPIPSKDSN